MRDRPGTKMSSETDQKTDQTTDRTTNRERKAFSNLIKWIEKTWHLNQEHSPREDIGLFANVIEVGGVGIALTTDGVGTKILVAQMMGKFDTVGIDCVAMNVNDLICVGAKPIAMLDYLAVEDSNPELFEKIGKGLYEGAKRANISIPGGEVALVKEMLKGKREGFGFDLVGMGIGQVDPDRIIAGRKVEAGDVLIGIESNGIHSNGLTLARKVIFEKMGLKVTHATEELGRTIGEELLRPTHIYVKEILEILESGVNVKALAHITGDGFLNLNRIKANRGFVIENLPEVPPIFKLIQENGGVPDEEMFETYNMGIGFCVVVPDTDASSTLSIVEKHGKKWHKLGHAFNDTEKRIVIKEKGLIGKDKEFKKARREEINSILKTG